MLTTQLFDQIDPEIRRILIKSLNSEELTPNDALKLLKVSGKEFLALQQIADYSCQQKKENIVTFVINRNINFSNICSRGCKFCSFSVPKGSKDGFLLDIEEIKKKIMEAKENHCTEVCIQGGINPDLTYDYYLDILKAAKEIDPEIHVHAFSPQEIYNASNLSGNSIKEVLRDFKNAGLDSIPGTAAEILVDDIRKIICPNKISTNQWIEIITQAHEMGIPTTCTIMYGHVEDLKDRVEHLEILRTIQKNTRGFTEFVALPFIKENPILSKSKEHPLKPSYGMADLKLFAVARLFFKDLIDNIQCSWVKLGIKFAQISLYYGVNDFSGTLMEENISRSAGATHGQYLPPDEIIYIIKAAGKRPAQRDTLYNILKYY
ncbi:MAG: 5-amino-6-(D-ribitylamino)uracil--L-tyrosine 4-hydroxyphenyl transferase CofH [Promethearchaeota archaeon]